MKKEPLLDLNEAVQHPGRRMVFNFETALEDDEELDLVTPVVGHIEAVSTGSQLLLESSFCTKCCLECARCGSPLEIALEFDMSDNFEVEGIPSSYASDSYAKVLTDEPTPLFKHNALYRDTYVRQGVWVNLPTQPLCEFGWDGDCPHAAALHSKDKPAGHPAFRSLEGIHLEDAE